MCPSLRNPNAVDGRLVGVVAKIMIAIPPGIDLVVVASLVVEIIVVMFSVCEREIVTPNLEALLFVKEVSRNRRSGLNIGRRVLP